MSTPQSTIHICSNVRLNNRYEHTIYFASAEAQASYFSGKVVESFTAYSYIRKSWELKVQATLEEADTWTYLFFKNFSDGKTYYYFINKVEYVNDNTVLLKLEIDVMQTYAFNYYLTQCFVEREHVKDDTIGMHVVEEGLELGELQTIATASMGLSSSELCILVLATFNPLTTTEDTTDTVLGGNYNGIFSGLGIYAVNHYNWNAWALKLKQLNDWGKIDGIISMWLYPMDLVELAEGEAWTNNNVVQTVAGATSIIKEISRNSTLDNGYKPRNNKLLTYPYNFLYMHNNAGGAGVFKYEEFGDPSSCNFKCIGALSPEGGAKAYPLNYRGEQHAYEDGLTLGAYPTCAWNEDIYKIWLAQNQNQHGMSMAMSGLTIAGGIVASAGSVATGNVLGAVGGLGTVAHGVSSVASLMAQKADKAIQPPQAKGEYSASININADMQTFTFNQKCISEDFAKRIDAYFDMYGYKVNAVKIPNRHVRENWTYTKTVNCHVRGLMTVEDLTKIESIFNNGITFWVNGDKIGQYGITDTYTNNPI